jgi:hypothetical protein
MTLNMSVKKTKKERAVALYEQNHHLPLDKVVRVFINELNLPSENSARTYISMSRKVLSDKLKINYKSRKIDSRKTKRGQAMEIFVNNISLTRQEMIELFVSELNMTHASAATHCSQCSQEYIGPKHKAIV